MYYIFKYKSLAWRRGLGNESNWIFLCTLQNLKVVFNFIHCECFIFINIFCFQLGLFWNPSLGFTIPLCAQWGLASEIVECLEENGAFECNQLLVALLIHFNHSTYSIIICRHQRKYLAKQVCERERVKRDGGEIIFN